MIVGVGSRSKYYFKTLLFSRYTFEVAPAFTLCEHTIIQTVLEKVNYNEGDGIFVPGESPGGGFGFNSGYCVSGLPSKWHPCSL